LNGCFTGGLGSTGLPLVFFLHFFGKNLVGLMEQVFFTNHIQYLSLRPKDIVQALKETQRTDSSLLDWSHPFFIHHKTPNGRGVALFNASTGRHNSIT